jgi:hypothetical protein
MAQATHQHPPTPNTMQLIKHAGTWTLKHGNNLASLGVGTNPKTGGTRTARELRRDWPQRVEETAAMLLREGTQSPYVFK